MKNIKKFKIDSFTYVFLLTSFLCGQIKNTIILFLIVIFHEFGHVFFALLFKFKIEEIKIYPFGGITKINYALNESSIKIILLALGGIIFQLILFVFINDSIFIKYNYYLLLFNLLPIIPLDGSKILFEIYTKFFMYKKCILLIIITSIVTVFIYILLNYYYVFNNYLIIILFISKIYEYYKYRKVIYKKFILERLLYNYGYNRIENNIDINNYKKNYRYYYYEDNHIISEKEYLIRKMQ